jgi:hypothetical protein
MLKWAVWFLVIASIVIAGQGAGCEKCYDPPTNPWIRHTLTLSQILFQKEREPFKALVESGREELVLVLQVTYLGSCPGLSRTLVKYLPGLDVESDTRATAVTIAIDAVVWQLAECWPPSPIAVRAVLWEEDMYDDDTWKIVRDVGRGAITVQSGKPERTPAEPWTVSLAGAFFDKLLQRINHPAARPQGMELQQP